jgi:hypothetical protein
MERARKQGMKSKKWGQKNGNWFDSKNFGVG